MSGVDLGLTVTVVNNASGALKGISNDVKGLGENSQATANRLKAIQVVIAGILVEKTLEYGKAVVNAVAATQQLDIRMAAFAGSAQNAHKVYDDLANSFKATPYAMDTIAKAWVNLRSVVSSNDQTSTIIKAVVNDVAALGGSEENITLVASAIQLMFARGTASARSYNSILQQTGITLGDLAKAAGVTSTEMERQLKQGFISAKQFVDDFVKASTARFGFFAQNLGASVGGALSLIQNTVSKNLSDIGANTNLNAHLTVIFQNLAAAIDGVMKSINQQTIDNFFNWLRSIEPFVINVAKGILNIGQAVLTLGGEVFTLLGKMPPEAIEYGMIGYFLLGKKGAAIGAAIGAMTNTMKNVQIGTTVTAAPNVDTGGVVGWLKQQDANAQAWFNRNGLSWLNKSLDQTVTEQTSGKHTDLMSAIFGNQKKEPLDKTWDLVGTDKQLAAAQAALDKLAKSFTVAQAAGTGMSSTLADAMDAANRETQQLQDTVDAMGDRLQQMTFKNAGDQLGASLQQIKITSDGYAKTIDAAIKNELALKVQTAANVALVVQLKALRGEINDQTDVAIAKEKTLYALQTQSFVAQQRSQQIQNEFAAQQLKTQTNPSGFNQLFQGTSAGQLQNQVLQQRAQLMEQNLNLTQQIADATAQLNDVTADPARTASLQSTIQSLQDYQAATQQALANTTVAAQMQNQLWQQLGQTMENDVANGITGLIEGTATLGDVARQVFGDMISMAIKYMLQLVEMQIFGQAASAITTATIAPQALAAQAMWAPAALAASIATFGAADGIGTAAYIAAMATSAVPFANGGVPMGGTNGGITQGPTLFGLAGEKGQEGIMPLTRVGGKLGVHASGMGGNTYEIHVHAIDTQSGLEFISKNIDQIDAHLQQRSRLNKRAG